VHSGTSEPECSVEPDAAARAGNKSNSPRQFNTAGLPRSYHRARAIKSRSTYINPIRRWHAGASWISADTKIASIAD
jgi:hypothetical protein